jgi:hypothetical protein
MGTSRIGIGVESVPSRHQRTQFLPDLLHPGGDVLEVHPVDHGFVLRPLAVGLGFRILCIGTHSTPEVYSHSGGLSGGPRERHGREKTPKKFFGANGEDSVAAGMLRRSCVFFDDFQLAAS